MTEKRSNFFSIVIGFRNRETGRIKNALEGLEKQTFANFELVFVDYGSDVELAEQVKQLVTSYPFATYVYSDTRGWFWNRAHALNTGIKLSNGNIIIISDIDLIFPPNYLESVNKLSFENTFYSFSCYYLTTGIDYSNVTKIDLHNSEVNYVGLCAVAKDDLVRNHCFDEYYMHWGGEDDDLYVRLNNSGCRKQHMKVDVFPVLHQWHSKHSPSYPTPWYLEMINYLYSVRYNEQVQDKEFGVLVNTSNRTILNKISETNCFEVLELFPNPLFQFNLFLDGFFKMASGTFGQFNFPIQPPLPKGRKQKAIEKMNSQLLKLKVPYLLEKKREKPPIHQRETWYDFVQYFIGKNRSFLNDYYLVDTDKKLALLFQKK